MIVLNNKAPLYLSITLSVLLLINFYKNWNLNSLNQEVNHKLQSSEERNSQLLKKKDNLEKQNSDYSNSINSFQDKINEYAGLVERKDHEIKDNKLKHISQIDVLERKILEQSGTKLEIIAKLNKTDESSKILREENLNLKKEIEQLKELVYDLELKKKEHLGSKENKTLDTFNQLNLEENSRGNNSTDLKEVEKRVFIKENKLEQHEVHDGAEKIQ